MNYSDKRNEIIDANDGCTMEELYDDAYRQGCVDTIKKACEWLKGITIIQYYAQFYFSIPANSTEKYTLSEESIEEFRKAMIN